MSETPTQMRGVMDAEERRQRSRKHVFAINGAAEFLNVVRELLEDEEYNVTTTNFVPNSLAQIVALEPSLIIIDLAISVRAGWDLLEQLHQDALTHGIPVIVVSTNEKILDEVRADPSRYGGERFIGKPLDIDVLISAVEDLIGKA